MSKFRKIPADTKVYKQTLHKYKKEYDEFIEFNLAIQDREKVKKVSGKSASYARYLIRLIIIYNDIYQNHIGDITTFNSVKNLEKLRSEYTEEFKKYNEEESRYPNATLNSYISYVTQLYSQVEDPIDEALNYDINAGQMNHHVVEECLKLIEGPQLRKKKVEKGSFYVYPRNKLVIYKAKLMSNWQCEFNEQHETFISMASKKPYVDAHHLIPMAAQGHYDNNIDFTDNIVCLCPTCHKRIHHAIVPQKIEMIEVLFKKREEKYSKYEIDINEKMLRNYYGIF